MGIQRVGQRIHVFWTDETAWFSGVVQQFSDSQGYYVVYDDGDERWEGLNESYRFDGQQSDDSDDDKDEHETEPGGRSGDVQVREATARAMEPPAPDDDGHSETYDDGGGGEEDANEDEGDEGDDEETGLYPQPADAYPKPVVLQDTEEEDDEENATHSEEDRGNDDDDAQSVALSEAPITYEPRRQATVDAAGSRRAFPHRGVLRGIVVGATNLPLVDKRDEPTAFARVAFVEAVSNIGDTGDRRQPSTHMLRCKETLSATQQVPMTSHPTWNELGTNDWDTTDHLDGLFQLQVVPPMSVLTRTHLPQPAWQQLKGDLLFSVHHQDRDAVRSSEFLGQASIPLSHLMRDLLGALSVSPCAAVTRQFPLESRQGKSIGGSAQVIVRFQFEPASPAAARRSNSKLASSREPRPPISARTTRSTTTPSIASSKASRPKSATSSSASRAGLAVEKQQQQQRSSRPHQSSSAINRRRFEQQLERENKAQAKRMVEQRREIGVVAARRQQLNHQPPLVKSEPKPGVVAVQTAPPRTHKASSAINRSKFVDHVKLENRSMGKRLIERAGLVRHAAAADAKRQNERLDWDDAKAQDKAHVLDRRRVGRQEKDYVLEKAQAKYQQQAELVEHVMVLQTDVAAWKAKLFTVKSNLQRVDAMNTKDTHVRDCLRRAADRTKSEPSALSAATSSSACRLEQLLANEEDDDKEEQDPAIRQHKRELRELFRETESLESDQRRLDAQLAALGQREESLESETVELHRKWHFVETKRQFQTKMVADRSQPARAAFATQQMRTKKQSLELSRDEEEQYAIYHAQEQLTQLQIATTVLRDRLEKTTSGQAASRTSSASSAACDNLREKIAKRKAKIELMEIQQSDLRHQYEALVAQGEYDALRAHAQELQHVLFLCESEAKHVAAAERAAKLSQTRLAMDLEKQRFDGQSETEILLKSSRSSTTLH